MSKLPQPASDNETARTATDIDRFMQFSPDGRNLGINRIPDRNPRALPKPGI